MSVGICVSGDYAAAINIFAIPIPTMSKAQYSKHEKACPLPLLRLPTSLTLNLVNLVRCAPVSHRIWRHQNIHSPVLQAHFCHTLVLSHYKYLHGRCGVLDDRCSLRGSRNPRISVE